MKQILIIVFVLISLFSLSGCAKEDSPVEIMDGPQVAGIVQEVSSDGLSVLVDSQTDMVTGLIWIKTDAQTLFDDGVSRTFKTGNNTAFIVTGGIMESYPMQGYADVVVKNDTVE